MSFDRIRRGGPGGQRRNKVETGIRAWLRHHPGVSVTATGGRSPEGNLGEALARLRLELARQWRAAWPPPAGLAAVYGRYRTPQGRLAVNPANPDAAPVLAVVLDGVAAGGGPRAAAALLGLTRTQLDDFLVRMDPATAQRLRRATSSATLPAAPALPESGDATGNSTGPDGPGGPCVDM